MHRAPWRPAALRRFGAAAATLCVAAALLPLGSAPSALGAPSDDRADGLAISDAFRPSADIGFHDTTRDGSPRPIRDDLGGELGGMVELVQATTSDPTGNAANERPDPVADRPALLLFTPTSEMTGVSVEVRVQGESVGTLELEAPHRLPASDQSYDERGSVAYSLRAWSAELPAEWMQPGLSLSLTSADGTTGTVDQVDLGAPDELVLNNIRLGMLTEAPASDSQPFITDPVASGTDYFQTLPVAKLTVAQYETVELDEVIVASGDIYTTEEPDPSDGSVYAGTMRENVGKAQVSTGINLATWGVTSSEMTQQQPGHTNQRVIHHSAGLYANGRHVHGLSGGNGMATLYSSTGNELSHELGHSYGLGHYPGTDPEASGDDVVRNASHHMDSGWGYIPYRGLMRSNLDTGPFKETASINGSPFAENLAGAYNFNADAMSGGWDASPVSQYTHHTAYSLTRIQDTLEDLVADTSYPSGYRAWDPGSGWADAAELDPEFDLPRPTEVGVPVFTILGGYNPADAEQTLVYPAFRSNHGVTFDLPQVDTTAAADERVCWLEVDFEDAETQHIALDASDGMKQLNVNLAESSAPTGAQVHCRTDETTTALGAPIEIATDLEPMDAPAVIGGDEGFEQLRAEELAELEPELEAQAGSESPLLPAEDLIVLSGWSDDLSLLSDAAAEVAERILALREDAADVEAYLNEHAPGGVADSEQSLAELAHFLEGRGYLDTDGQVTPAGSPVTVDGGHCLHLDETNSLRVDSSEDCAASHDEAWFADGSGRIHLAADAGMCLTYTSPTTVQPCSMNDPAQHWVLQEGGYVVRANATNSALDANRSTGYVTTYALSGTNNQKWDSFETADNVLLNYLSSNALTLLSAVGPLPEPVAPEEPKEPTEPVEPEEPTEPAEPTEPGESVEPDKPTESSEPAGPSEPTGSAAPAAPDTGATAPTDDSTAVRASDLARTGVSAMATALIGAAALIAGAVLLIVRHRRTGR